MRKTALALLTLTTTLVACKPPQTPEVDALKPFTSQTLNWTTCDPTILGMDSQSPDVQGILNDPSIAGRLTCADVRVPANWSNPAAGTASFALIRVAASDTAKRQGAIFFNPGGPGGDGLIFAPLFAYQWASDWNPSENATQLKAMTQQYDLIGFSPRGVGASSRLNCGTNEFAAPINPPTTDQSDANFEVMKRQGRLLALACQKNPLTPLINTDATARDLNLARQLMGDAKLNYIGYSYGTWLGSWYAKLFPQQTGRMLLDGNMSWNTTMEHAFGLQPAAFERDFRDALAPYLARQNATFGLGGTGAEVYAAQNRLAEPLRSVMGNIIAQFLYQRDAYHFAGELLKTTVVLDALIKAHPDATSDELMSLAAQATYFDDPDMNARAAQNAQFLLMSRESELNLAPFPVELDASSSTFTAITCNDTPWTSTLEQARAKGRQDAEQYPLVGGYDAANPCYQWKGGPSVKQPALPKNMPPILMLQNELDPATPQEGALEALNSTPSAKMILIDDEPQHAAFPYGTTCVDGPITEYFLTGKLPSNKLNSCPALPLWGEEKAVPVKTLTVKNGGLCIAQPTLSSQALGEQRLTAARNETRRIITQNAQRFLPTALALNPELRAKLTVRDCQ
ncbi:transporter [Deinococcus arenae]|uniref:Transporter n=1 Tax=Deinococcus arenae TaxID=1452751 RepID=A0A8H9GNL4_9DEIO|nr:alpha/beta hydrolase [Deinococcus arenae]AWT36658.1 alpha/beta hydrolase [Deinococcus actinosclerus]GGM41624.1 transporter [Deinococcus arenae]